MGIPRNMKLSFGILSVFVFALACSVLAAPTVRTNGPKPVAISITKLPEAVTKAGFGCKTCASLTGQGLNILLNYILNAGVVGTCGKLCGNLKQKTERTVCSLACDLVGIKAFVTALEKADLDPLYFCGELGLCKHDDNGAGKLSSLTVDPATGQQGSTFTGQMQVTVTNHTGVG